MTWKINMLSLAAACFFCNAVMAYSPEAFTNPAAHLEKSYVSSSIPRKIVERLPPATVTKPPVRRIKLVLEQTRIDEREKKQVIEFHEEITLLDNGIVRTNMQRPDLHFASYQLSYGNLLPLRSESLKYTKPKQGVVDTKTIAIPRFENFPPVEGKKAVLSYQQKTFGLPADPVVTLECMWTGVREARLIASNLPGKATDFKCDALDGGKKLQTIAFSYLQAYGLYIEISSEPAPGMKSYFGRRSNIIRNVVLIP